ncbi:type VII secretion protein EssB [Bacillus thuringiensis]|uniref:type VII secretion protein EssB n=1 Tax=Bacillus thuringiensis TaxID=1428 RepID=UPI003671F922
MAGKIIQIDAMNYQFQIEKENWKLEMTKSQTRIKDFRQFDIITGESSEFVPLTIEETDDMFTFLYQVDKKLYKWDDLSRFGRNEKLRLLRNVAQFRKYLNKRITFFLHPDNIVFNANLIPSIIHRGIRDIVPPTPLSEEQFLTQYKCLIIALFSQKHNFDDLYAGLLKDAKETTFEQTVAQMESLDALLQFLDDSFEKEQTKTEKNMQLVPKKSYKSFKYLAFSFIAATVILAAPLIYFTFIKFPYQNKLLEANASFIATDYDKVITQLNEEEFESLPIASKYELAFAYITAEKLGEAQKKSIMKNISLKSDEKYLLYWMYNGKGNFDKSLDLAKTLDDPQLIMYGLVKQIESLKNNPDLSGEERDQKLKTYEQQLDEYKKKYGNSSSDKNLSDTEKKE